MTEPSVDALRAHVLAQLEPQLTRVGSQRIASALLAMLDENGLLEMDPILAAAFEDLERCLKEQPTSKRSALLAALAFMAGEDRAAALEAFERLTGDDLPHALREAIGAALARLDRYLQHLSLLRREVVDAARAEPALRGLVARLDGDVVQVRDAAQEALRRSLNVRSATRVIAFLDEPPPPLEGAAADALRATASGAPNENPEPSLLETLVVGAESAWRAGRFEEAKRALDRAMGRDVLHDERDVALRLMGALGSRAYSTTAWAREARRELAVVTLGRLTECAASEVRLVLALVHACDPVGVAARDRAELVRLQARWDDAPAEAIEIADRAIEALEGDVDYPALSARFGLSSTALKALRVLLSRYRDVPVARLVLGPDAAAHDLSFSREGPAFVLEPGWKGVVPAQPTEELLALGRALLARIEDFMRYGLEKLVPVRVEDLARASALTVDQARRVSEGVRVDTPWGIVAMRHLMRSSPRMVALGGEDE